jgi:hypothetical protein
MQEKLENTETEKKRDRTLIMQKENKISMLEAKLGVTGGQQKSPISTQKQQFSNLKNPNQRQVGVGAQAMSASVGAGKITKATENSERLVMDGIQKRPTPQSSSSKA